MAPEKDLDRVTFVLDAQGWIIESVCRGMSFEAVGFLWTLMPHAALEPLPKTPSELAKLAETDPMTAGRLWPKVARFFVETDRGWVIGDHDWLRRTKVRASARVPLRHLFHQLVRFWGKRCAYCKASGVALEIEHIVPKARGGSDAITNLTVACWKCNNRKSAKTAAEFGFPDVHERAALIE